MKKYLSILFLFAYGVAYSQQPLDDVDACQFAIYEDGDTIEFIKIGTDVTTVKPVILFCQGSLPIPLVIEWEDGSKIIPSINNFDYQSLSQQFHIIVISMPHIPLLASKSSLNSQYAYVTDKNDKHSYPLKYNASNYLERYVERGCSVIDFLTKQSWADIENILVVGHSQGARVATKIAQGSKHISALGFLSGNPLGRVDQYIRSSRLQQQKGKISAEEAQNQMNNIYNYWKWVNENPELPSQKGEDSPRATISFSVPIIDDLTHLTIPVFVAYGTEDITSSYCDILPIDFIRAGKENFEVRPYLGFEHNYFEVDESGKPLYDKCHWDEVMADFVDWYKKIRNRVFSNL